MTKLIYAMTYLLAFLALAIAVHHSKRQKSEVGKVVRGMLICEMVMVATAFVPVFCMDTLWVSIAFSIHLALLDWFFFGLMRYTLKFNGLPVKVAKQAYVVSVIIIWVDGISLGLNPFYGHVLEYVPKHSGGQLYELINPGTMFWVHIGICGIFYLLAILALVYSLVKSASVYRFKSGFLLGILVAAGCANQCLLLAGLKMDVAILFYVVMGLAIYFFSFIYVPQSLMNRIYPYLIQEIDEAVLVFDNTMRCVAVNEKVYQYFGDDVRTGTLGEFCGDWGLLTEEETDASLIRKVSCRVAGEEKIFQLQYQIITDKRERYVGSFIVLQDVTMAERNLQDIRYMATHDRLTGVYNRDYFFEKCKALVDENPQEKFTIFCSDIERFRLVNDVLGVEFADRLLIAVGRELRALPVEKRVYGRLEADKFAVCIPKKDFSEELALRVVTPIQEFGSELFPISCDIGVYDIIDRDISVSVMCDRAMMALKTIKGDVQANIAYYDDKMRETLLKETEIINDMNYALEDEQFVIYLQPQINPIKNKVVGAEALVRWIHPVKGMVSPGEFIPVFEKTGFIVQLDKYVWELACKVIQRWRKEGRADVSVSVNISPRDFYYLDVYEVFSELVEKYDIPSDSLRLEITESAFVLDVRKQRQLIDKLHSSGFIIEMDDFGSGYSSLNTLKDMPVDILKMDMIFLSKTDEIERSRQILQSVIELAARLQMPVVAEGVETKEQAEYLTEIGCDTMQGYYYARPMPVEEFEKFHAEYGKKAADEKE